MVAAWIGRMRKQIRSILVDRGVLVAAARAHSEWLKQTETKYPPGPRGGLAAVVKDARKLEQQIKVLGLRAVGEILLPQFVYAAERWKQMTDPSVITERPYLRYVCCQLPDSRPGHAEKHGLIFRWDDPFWDQWYPINGLGCMCTVTSVSQSLLDRRGWKVSTEKTFQYPMPDEGFNFNIGKLV